MRKKKEKENRQPFNHNVPEPTEQLPASLGLATLMIKGLLQCTVYTWDVSVVESMYLESLQSV